MRSTLAALAGGYFPAAMAFGALATAVHTPPLWTLGLSALAYSGALQMTVLGLWAAGASPLLVLPIGLLVNLRHMLYGPHLDQVHPQWSARSRWGLAAFLTDEVYVVGISSPFLTPGRLLPVALWAYGIWLAGTRAGIALTGALPPQALLPLTFALPSLFLGLLLPRLRERGALMAAGVATAAALASRAEHLPAGTAILAILIGTTAGYGWVRLRGGEESS